MGTQRKRIFLLVLSGLLLLSAVTGCTTNSPLEYSRQDVEDYLAARFPGKDAVIQGGSWWNQTWNCHLNDLPDMVFQVYSYRSGGDPVPVWTYVLTDNFGNALSGYWAERYQAEGGSLEAWHASLEEGATAPFRLYFLDRTQVTAAVEQFSAFQQWAADQPYGERSEDMYAEYILSMDDGVWEDYYIYADSTRVLQLPEDDPAQVLRDCEELLLEYVTFLNLPGGFTQEERNDYAQSRWDWDSSAPGALYRDNEEIPREVFTGIGLYGDRLSYGGLYEMLLRLDLAPDGTPEHFVFTGADGYRYVFSYDFSDIRTEETANGGEKTTQIWYYLRDGVRNTLPEQEDGPLLSVKSEAFTAMTGLSCPEHAPGTEPSGGISIFLDGENKLIWSDAAQPEPGIQKREDGVFTIRSDKVKQSWNEETQHIDFWLWSEEQAQWTVYVWNEASGQYTIQAGSPQDHGTAPGAESASSV